MTAKRPGDDLRVAEVIQQSLAKLLKGPQKFLITNESMRHLVQLYFDDLAQASGQGRIEELLESWPADVDLFRRKWLAIARTATARFHGMSLPVATESATFGARDECHQVKKRRSRSGTRRPGRMPRRNRKTRGRSRSTRSRRG
jgi:hypothetical protein